MLLGFCSASQRLRAAWSDFEWVPSQNGLLTDGTGNRTLGLPVSRTGCRRHRSVELVEIAGDRMGRSNSNYLIAIIPPLFWSK